MRMLAAALVLLDQTQDAKEAENLFKAVQERIEKAKTLRFECAVTSGLGDQQQEIMTLSVKLKGTNRWALECKMGPEKFGMLCDGRNIIVTAALQDGVFLPGNLKVEDMGKEMRRSASNGVSLFLAYSSTGLIPPLSVPEQVKGVGKEKIGEVEALVVEYKVQWNVGGRPETIAAKAFLDPVQKRIIKRELTIQGQSVTETFSAFAIDEDYPDSDFIFQSNRRFARAQAQRLAGAAALFGRCTGRHPSALEELARRPQGLEADIFWPEGGYLLGGTVPKDPWGRPFELKSADGKPSVVSLGADGKAGGKGDDEDTVFELPPVTGGAVGAPTERLKNHYTARVQIHLMAATVKAYRDSYGELPAKKAALWEKPEWATVWPEGGWLPGGKMPVDPWGEAYRMISDAAFVRVQTQDPKSRALSLKDLTAEERAGLEERARPRLSAEQKAEAGRLVPLLSDDDAEARDRAQRGLQAMGPAVLGFLEERLKTEKDQEAVGRMEAIRKSIPLRRAEWIAELRLLHVTVQQSEISRRTAETGCVSNLSQLWKMQHIYMSKFGGRQKLFCKETGKDFWLALTKTNPPLIDSRLLDMFVCPASGEQAGEGVCTYAGPASNVNALGDGDVVGMCDDEAHGDAVVILLKSSDVQTVSRGDPLYTRAQQSTKK